MGGDRQAKTISKDHKEGRLNMTKVKAYNKIRLRSYDKCPTRNVQRGAEFIFRTHRMPTNQRSLQRKRI